MGKQDHVVIVDDDAEIRSLVRDYLGAEGFRVSTCADGDDLMRVMAGDAIDVLILDVRLPGRDGVALASEVHHMIDAGIIILSQKDQVIDRVAGLEAGADDYMPKPFHLRELLARVHSVLRRRETHGASAIAGAPIGDRGPNNDAGGPAAGPLLRVGDWMVNRAAREVRSRAGAPLDLTQREFDLLCVFMDHPGMALSRDRLLDLTAGRSAEPFDRAIDTQVGRLRRKIEANPHSPALIKTVRGVGYKLAVPVRPVKDDGQPHRVQDGPASQRPSKGR